jgi:predicted AAA+ superfamily ATPase
LFVLFFDKLSDDGLFLKFRRLLATLPPSEIEAELLIRDAVSEMIEAAETLGLDGDLWEKSFALLLARDDNTLGRVCEMSGEPGGSIRTIAAAELSRLHGNLARARELSGNEFNCIRAYTPSNARACLDKAPAVLAAEALAGKIAAARMLADEALANETVVSRSGGEMADALIEFYRFNGSGIFAAYRAFRWSRGEGLEAIESPDGQTLASLIGYDDQKSELLSNTRSFLGGHPANNALLFGDSGTGKSSSVKALLNEPGFAERGLRMIEVDKDNIADIPRLMGTIKPRAYRFIIFIDDVSFETFETGYKQLKAAIEGMLSGRPDNVVIYATSNRRNIVREVWSDRKAASDDVHGADSAQEKLSLADRFGLVLWYGSAGKQLYLDMIKHYARAYGADMPDEEIESAAMKYVIGRGGFTGRMAKQCAAQITAK